MPAGYLLRLIAATAFLATAPACAHGPQSAEPSTVASTGQAGSTITIEVRRNDRLAMFLFAYHAARSLSTAELRDRIALTDADTAALAEQADAFASLEAAMQPYLDTHPLRDRNMLVMSGHLSGAEVEFPDPAVYEALIAFEPVYLKHFAPRHRMATHSMAELLEAQLDMHGEAMARTVAREVEGEWRENDPILLELVPYVSRAGAFTINYFTVMSSMRTDYRDHALEMAFHEAAHTSPMTNRIKAVAEAALARHGIENRRFWHYLQFHAIGRAAKSVLGEHYVPYHKANGLDRRESAAEYYAAIEAVWDEHDTLAERADAAIALIAANSSS
ncbi:MAG: hypothetical protein ACX930_00075 [Erythrobacter sp.]